jgi:hypothetical protein
MGREVFCILAYMTPRGRKLAVHGAQMQILVDEVGWGMRSVCLVSS